MISPRLLALIASTAAIALLSCVAAAAATPPAPVCATVSIGIDTTRAYLGGSIGAIFGEGVGETFVANDTLIESVTVWRPAPEDTNYTPIKFWIINVDPVSGYPQPASPILSGDTLTVPFGDHVHATAIQYVFSPPYALPHKGTYAFVFQETCAGYNDLLMDLQDDYPSGQAFRTNPRNDGCVLLGGSWLGVDLIFTIDFCDTTTPVRRETWGKLKVLYR